MAGRFCGHTDPALNERGCEGAEALAARLRERPVEVVYSSDLRRAAMTAEAVVSGRAVEVELRAGLREIFFGEWEGLRWREIEDRDGAYAEAWAREFPAWPAPGGETYAEFCARVMRELGEVQAMARGRHALVVTHGGVLRTVLQLMCGADEATAWRRTEAYCCQVEGAEVLA